jgi:hypothetical protein
MNSKKTASIFIATFLFIGGFYLSRTNSQIESVLFLFPPLLAAILGLYAANTYKLENIHGRSTAFLAAGLGFFFIGELLFYFYQFVFHKMPFPSVADVFYLLAYPLLLWGLLIEVKMHKPKLSEFSKRALTVMITLLLVLTAIVSYFGIYKAYDSSSSFLANVIGMGYGVADLIILVPTMYVLKLAFQFRGGKLFNSWMLIFFAILFMLAADILFASYNDQYSAGTWPYNLIDLLWTASYLLFGYSFFYTASALKELHNKFLKSKLTK